MLESKINVMKECLWPAGIAAFAIHGLMIIAAMALGTPYPQGTSSQDFRAEVMFASDLEKGTSGLLTSPLVGEGDSDRREDLSHKGRGQKQPISKQKSVGKEASANLISSLGGQPSGEADATPIFNPPPIYPYEAKRKGIQGIVLVRLYLTETGVVHKATTLPPRIDPLLEDAALSAVHTWRFKPGARTLEVPIEFKLET